MSLLLPQPYPATSSFHLQSHPSRLNLLFNTKIHFNSTSKTSISISSRRTTLPIIAAKLPARDLTIQFGEHKGKKLGAIPSKYLKWLVKNVKLDEWNKHAEEVLKDPVYRDRIEWEIFKKPGPVVEKKPRSSVALDPAERFGWDFQDRDGWADVNEDLLGTSYSGRIPRTRDRAKRIAAEKEAKRLRKEEMQRGVKKIREERVFVGGESRRARLERRRENREVMKLPEEEEEEEEKPMDEEEEERIKFRTTRRKYRIDGSQLLKDDVDDDEARRVQKVYNPFPGRASLIEKVIDRLA